MFQNAVRRNSISRKDKCCLDALDATASQFGNSKSKNREIEMKISLLA